MRRTIAALLAAGLLVAAGCGDDDEDEGAAQDSGAATTATTTGSESAGGGYGGAGGGGGGGGGGDTAVSLVDFRIDPANPTVKAGRVTFSVTNDGSAPHALEVEGNGIEEETKVLNGGESDELTVELQAGEYEWYCPVGNHAAMGMEGTLTVE